MRLPLQRAFAGLVLFLVLALAGCQSPSATSTTNTASTNQGYPPINLHYDADRYEFTTPQSMCSAILTAEVKGITHGKSYWNSPDGLRPHITAATAHASISQTITEQGYRIYTPVQFGSMKIFKDQRKQATKKFVTVGGHVQQDQIWIDQFSQLKDGDHYVIVFGPGSQPLGKGKVEEWLTVYNAFLVDKQGMITLQNASSPNEPGPGKTQPAVKISLTDLQHQLATCR